MPEWLHILALLSLGVGILSAVVVAMDETRHPQRMWIMNVVWPLVALFGSLAALWAYFRYGRLAAKDQGGQSGEDGAKPKPPFPVMVGKGAAHCGSGCALGDLVAETLAYLFPAIAIWLGWKTIFAEKMYAVWVLDYVLAFSLGILFQYFTIAPMRGLGVKDGLIAAVKADFLSLTAWQVGMYGFMAFAQFYLFRHLLGIRLEPVMPEFWFMMQIAMWAGFLTAYPVNWWLISAGVKERM